MLAYSAEISRPAYRREDDISLALAIAFVEYAGSGQVIRFHKERNMPYCLPEYVYRSTGLWVYEDGVWYAIPIHGGGGGRWAERPQ